MAILEDGGPDLDPAWVARIRRGLLAWFPGAARDLPWRADRDPYRILVSEMMLVQTTVAAVIPHFARFLRRFPTVESLAVADEADVLKAWEGLGYYRRARHLHGAARAVVNDHGGVFPADPEAIRALPGVGRYVAGAILSFAFDRPAPIVEANTRRVLARWLAWREALGSSRSQARLWAAAGRLVPDESPGAFNQAFMELGALICTARNPSCLVCPVSADCRTRASGLQDAIPTLAPRPVPLAVEEAAVLIARDGKVLVARRGPGRLWDGFWEFPTVHVSGADPAGRSPAGDACGQVDLAAEVLRLTGIRAEVGPAVHTVLYGVTKHKVRLVAHAAASVDDAPPRPGPGLDLIAWELPADLARYPFSAAGRRILEWLTSGGQEALRFDRTGP